MDNLINLIRLQGLFGPKPLGNDLPEDGGITGNLPRTPIFNPDMRPDNRPMFPIEPIADTTRRDSLGDNTERIFNPNTEMSDYYKDILYNEPVEKKPGFLRHILAGFAGNGDIKLADAVLHKPYNDELAQWNNRLNQIKPAMNDENADNNVQRQLKVADMKDQRDRKKEEDANNIAQQKVDIAAKRAKIYEFKATHPNWVLKEVPGGNYVMFNPQNPGESVDTGIETGKLTDIEKNDLGLQRDLKKISAQGDKEVKVEGVREKNRENLENVREGNRENLEGQKQTGRTTLEDRKQTNRESTITTRAKATGSGGSKSTTPNATQQAVATANKAREIIAEHPEWKDYIKVDKDRVITKRPYFNSSMPEYNKAIEALYGTGASHSSAAPQSTGVPKTPKVGDTYTWPNGNVGKWNGRIWEPVKVVTK